MPPPMKIVNQTQCRIPGGTADISATMKDLKVPHIPIQLMCLACVEATWVREGDSGLS